MNIIRMFEKRRKSNFKHEVKYKSTTVTGIVNTFFLRTKYFFVLHCKNKKWYTTSYLQTLPQS